MERLKVRAKALGYYGDIRRRQGDVFELVEREVGDKQHRRKLTVDQQFSENWMEKVDDSAKSERQSQSAVTRNDADIAEVKPSKAESKVEERSSKHETSKHETHKGKRSVI